MMETIVHIARIVAGRPVVALEDIPPARLPVRMYAGAQVDRTTADWLSIGTSADSEIVASLRNLRARSRQLVRDNDNAKHVIRVFANNVVGTGIGFQAINKNRPGKLRSDLNLQIEKFWKRWSRKSRCDVSGRLEFWMIERLAFWSIVENGECLIRKIKQPFGDSGVPFALQLIESDQLMDQWQSAKAPNGNAIRMGVEIDEYRRPVAYWLYPTHPGDYQFSQFQPSKFIRIPASEIIHLYIPERVNQTRGVPWLHTAMRRLHNMGGLEESEIIKARAQAAVMGFVTSPEAPAPDDTLAGQRVEYMAPGEIRHLLPGEDFRFADPSSPNPSLDPFSRFMLRNASSGVGLSYESASGDYSATNYSSSRLGQFNERDHFRILQHWFIQDFRQAIYSEWLEAHVMAGKIAIPDYYGRREEYDEAAQYRPRGWGWTNPKDDVPAYKSAVRSGFMTVEQVISENTGSGADINEIWAAREEEIDLAQELGLMLDTDPAQTDAKGAAQASAINPETAKLEGDADQSEADAGQSESDIPEVINS